MTVEVTQYMRPDGHQVVQFTDIGDEFREAYATMLGRGWNLAAEHLMSGMISLTIEDREEGEDVNIRVVSNGPSVQKAIEEMLQESCSVKQNV